MEGYVQRARTFDRIFAAQPSAVDYFRENDIEATWLPLAANPDYHKPWDEKIIYDWIALWHNVAERIEYTALLREAFPNGFVGYKDGKAYAEWMSKARCAVSLSRSDELTLRVFEVMAMGARSSPTGCGI